MSASATGPNCWADLCQKYKLANEKSFDAYFRTGRLAVNLKSALATACGCSENYISHYSYKHGYVPEADTFERVDDGWASVSKSETGWVFGLAILLEIAPNTHPKMNLITPVDVELANEWVDIDSRFFDGKERISTLPEKYVTDLARVAELMYQGLNQALDAWGQGKAPSKKIGFAAP